MNMEEWKLNKDIQIVALKAMLKYIEFEVVSKCCPVCGGNQWHDSGCVLAAFLYPEKYESYKYHIKSTPYHDMMWHISNDARFDFLRNDLLKAQDQPQKKEFTLFYSTFTQLEESGKLDGFKDVVGTEEDRKTAEEAECPNCQGNCHLVATQSDKGTVRNFAVCEHCDTAMEF